MKSGPRVETLELMGRSLRISTELPADELDHAVRKINNILKDMKSASELRWGPSPKAQDPTAWLLVAALNLAHQVVRLQRDANLQTQNLEQTLSLLTDIPDPHPVAPLPDHE